MGHGTIVSMAILFVLVGIAVITATVLLATNRWPDPGLADDSGDVGRPALVEVPIGELSIDAVDELHLDQAVRGYKMSDVDAVVERLTAELADRNEQIRQLRGD